MMKPRMLRVGDRVAIVSLSSGMLGEEFCSHNIEIGVRRLKIRTRTRVYAECVKRIDYLNKHPEKEGRGPKGGVFGRVY